ncbi:thiamine phosphate synthase [Candidatus Entotheonella serta]|nr:thiamine phosphate synthase [Candidatus Entotheonella serta]
MNVFPESSLYLITDRDLSRGRSTPEVVKAALAGGVDVVQLRDKIVETSEMVEDGLQVRELTAKAGKPLIINDRVDVALAIEAEGAHVGQTDIPAAMARALLTAPSILGVSTSAAEMARRAYRDGADYIGFGPLYHTSTKQTVASPRGLEMLPQVLEAVPIPVVVLGGISPDNIEDVVIAGADHVAVCSCIVAADDVQRAAADLKERMEKARAKRRASTS